MTIHRVKHGSIPASDFKPEKSRPKVLRWFQYEAPFDYWLSVGDEVGGKYVLWADSVSIALIFHQGEDVIPISNRESLAQSNVDQIEVAPDSPHTHNCDFVIFQNSPILRRTCLAEGQGSSHAPI